ncbi:hypothetical protein TRIATDRAFT_309986 [Trichoderma atroviride IMI 206040]|uniref:Protein kinase domain-containing protein n=1 Tax=Hypocrea atroviridis (strain ATCC 20476 / IMI 206040) TaxID=452589 RepID=G9P0S6_HYPAI|nr:uncharacterized protein TRIATDRAFT_309986 [Trichoderma atroviride IMI 206040]EHK42393.1 hypothetical protein TRIATDRAFT_309986 [Trichoderma atroviride IMI 206040]
MSLFVKSLSQLLNKDKSLNPSLSKQPDPWPAPRQDAREALAFEDVVTQLFAEAPPSEEATRPFTESFIEFGTLTHTAEEPAPESLASPRLLAKAQPTDDEAIQSVNGLFILPEEDGHLKKITAPQARTQPLTQQCVPAEDTSISTEESIRKELTAQQRAEAPSLQESDQESQPFTQPYVLLVDSTDTPEAIESMEATIRNMRPSDKKKEAECAQIASVPSVLFKYGYRAETIESETKRDVAAILQYTYSRVPDTRLIISHRSKYVKGREMSSSSAIISPKQPLRSRDTFGVIQRTQDVDFTIDLLHSHNSSRLNCQIIYRPDSDNCFLVNHTGQDMNLVSLNSEDPWSACVAKGWYTVIVPSIFELTLSTPKIEASDASFCVEIMLLKKQFNICIPRPHNHAPQKRSVNHARDETTSTKRQKLNNRKAESTNFQLHLSATGDSIIPKSRRDYVARIADLRDGETAIISSLAPGGGKSIVPAVRSSYQLRRHSSINKTAFSQVFTARHSEISKDLVVKTPRSQDPIHLMLAVKIWKREKTTLERLNHPNIVTLIAFDSRILALYLEELPKSLFRGSLSTFEPLNAYKILYGVASALKYLATRRIVHNDIKPKNIAYCRSRGAVLFDFGAATSPKFEQPTGGTAWYMPPEFIETSARGAPGDIWALGITMLYVTGKIQHPDRSSNNWHIIDTRHQIEPAYKKALDWLRLISDQRAKLDQKDNVESLIYRMLQPEPIYRINAAAIITELRSGTLKPIRLE